MIKFSNGHAFEYMAASGALSFDGKGWPWEQPLRWVGLLDPSLFTVVIKTLTLPPRRGNLRWYNPLKCVRPLFGGAVNAVDLTNPGIDWWCKKIGPLVDSSRFPLVGSIFGELDELATMASMLNDFDLVGLEINASCPNTKTDVLSNTRRIIRSCEIVKENSRFPLILKVSVTQDTETIVKEVERLIEALSINSVPWMTVFPDRRSPLANLGGGGVSGKIIQPFTWGLVKKLAGITPIPIIGPSIWDFDDLEELRRIGAKAISFGSVFLCHPWRPTLFVRKEQRLR